MKTRVQKVGDELSLPIPPALAAQAGLSADAEVEVSAENGALVVRPAGKPHYRLDDLLRGVTDENLHGEIDTGPPVGNEIW